MRNIFRKKILKRQFNYIIKYIKEIKYINQNKQLINLKKSFIIYIKIIYYFIKFKLFNI